MSLVPMSTASARTPAVASTSRSKRSSRSRPASGMLPSSSSRRLPLMPRLTTAKGPMAPSSAWKRRASQSGQRRLALLVLPTPSVIESPTATITDAKRSASTSASRGQEPRVRWTGSAVSAVWSPLVDT